MRKLALLLILGLPLLAQAQQNQNDDEYYLIILDGEEKYRSKSTGQIVVIEDITVVTVKQESLDNSSSKTENSSSVSVNDTGYTKYHTVEPHETLYSIAKSYGLTVDELREQNDMGASDILEAGQLLRIESKTSTTVQESNNNQIEYAQEGPTTHTVTKGDTLYNIAKRYKLTVDELKQLNGLTDNTIKIGQTLRLT